jgi:hypothetical protein
LTHAVVTAAAFLTIAAPVFSQEVGVKAGINSASLTPEEDENPDTSRRIGFVGGAWIRIPMTPRFSFQAEGLWSEKGVTFNVPAIEDVPAGELDIRLRYLEVPLQVRGDFGRTGSNTRFFLLGGAAPAFKLGARGKFDFAGQKGTQDLDEDIKAFDLGLVGGAGVEFGLAVVEARYTYGVTHINTDDNGDEDRIKNRVFSVTFGFRFH